MRSVLCCLIIFSVIAVKSEDAEPKNAIEEDVLNLLTKWRTGETNTFLYPLPPLDKIKIPPVNGSYEGYGARISYSTNNLILAGLNMFSVEQLDIRESALNASALLTVPVLTLSSDRYKINGRALFIPISGSGEMSILFRKIQLKISMRLRTNSTRMWLGIGDIQLSFQVGSLIANLKGGPNAVVLLLNASGVNIIQGYHDDIVRTVKRLIVPAINQFLAGNNIATLTQLFQLVKDVQGAPRVEGV